MNGKSPFVYPFVAVVSSILFATVAFAAPPVFTGDATVDFTDPSALFFSDSPAFPDVGMPKPPFALGDISGWDMRGVYLQYDKNTDTMYVGIDCFTICGDADNDGDPSTTGPALTSLSGTDQANLSGTESFAAVFDVTQTFGCPLDGVGDVVAGVASAPGANVSDFDIYDYVFPGCPDGFFGSGCPFTSTGAFPGNSVPIGGVALALFANPSAAAPDIEFALSPFSALPGATFTPSDAFSVELNLFGGSIDDDGIGEDFMSGLCFDVTTTTTTTTSTTTTTICQCGDGFVQPGCGEACEPNGAEICDNHDDDDGDNLVDCADDDCFGAVTPTCSAECAEQNVICKGIKDDPAVIYVNQPAQLGYWRVHGRVDAMPGDFDPNATGITFELYNANGLIYSGTLPPGSWTPYGIKNGYPTRYSYRNKAAKTAGGIARCGLRFRNVQGEPSFTIQLETYGDFSAATLANMTTQWYGVGDIGVLTADWTQTNTGWKLARKSFN